MSGASLSVGGAASASVSVEPGKMHANGNETTDEDQQRRPLQPPPQQQQQQQQQQNTSSTPATPTPTPARTKASSYLTSLNPLGNAVVSGLRRHFSFSPSSSPRLADSISNTFTSASSDGRSNNYIYNNNNNNNTVSTTPAATRFSFFRRSDTYPRDAMTTNPSPSPLSNNPVSPRPTQTQSHRTLSSPLLQPPPLTPITLRDTPPLPPTDQLLTRALAEEIRLLLPPRLQLMDTWRLVYSLARDGSSLATLFRRAREVAKRSLKAGYVVVVRDAAGVRRGRGRGNRNGNRNGNGNGNGNRDRDRDADGDGGGRPASLFGAYLTDPPHPDSHFYGTGECFLWKAIGAEVRGQGRAAAAAQSQRPSSSSPPPPPPRPAPVEGKLIDDSDDLVERETISTPAPEPEPKYTQEPTSSFTPAPLHFKAFPYSGINDYMIFCETGFLSVGAGDGHYGLWLDDNLEKGISCKCPTFGNEPLSDEGEKFDVLGVELWYVGS